MADIVICYKHEEQATAQAVADALRGKGWTVWWDPKLRAGEHFDDAIEKAIRDAKCVIVLWSKLSTKSEYVKDEASFARKLGKLVPVAIDDAELPFRFQGLHTVKWRGSSDTAGLQSLAEQLQEKIGSATSAADAVSTGTSKPSNASASLTVNDQELQDTISQSLAKFRLDRRIFAGKTVSPEDVGSDGHTLLRMHAEIERTRAARPSSVKGRFGIPDKTKIIPSARLSDAGDILGKNSPPGFDSSFFGSPYGVLARLDLEEYEKYDAPRGVLLRSQARQLLNKLQAAGADAIDYTPEQLKKLPAKLQDRGFYLLLLMPDRVLEESGPLRITQQTFDWYASTNAHRNPYSLLGHINSGFPGELMLSGEEIEEVGELAKCLGFHFKLL